MKMRFPIFAALLLLTAAPMGAQSAWSNGLDRRINSAVSPIREEYGRVRIDDWLQYAPAAAYLVSGAFRGGGGEHGFAERLVALATSAATEAIIVNGLKYTCCRLRPDGVTANSFPSGHTATVFMGAELIRQEYGGWAGAGAYALATGVGLLRVYNGYHWFTDVLAGAAVGVVSANIARWLLPAECKLLGISPRAELSVVPLGTGLLLSLTF